MTLLEKFIIESMSYSFEDEESLSDEEHYFNIKKIYDAEEVMSLLGPRHNPEQTYKIKDTIPSVIEPGNEECWIVSRTFVDNKGNDDWRIISNGVRCDIYKIQYLQAYSGKEYLYISIAGKISCYIDVIYNFSKNTFNVYYYIRDEVSLTFKDLNSLDIVQDRILTFTDKVKNVVLDIIKMFKQK